jgi:hypothetical protein
VRYAAAVTQDPWLAEEGRMVLVARRALARALRRPALTIGLALVLSAGFVVQRARQAPSYTATLYFRLAEGDLDTGNAPRPLRDIREYIVNVALSRTRAEEMMKKYGISTARLQHDRIAAIDDFRDDIQVEVSRNYFIFDRQPDEPARSAQVTVSFAADDPARARAMVHEVGDAILGEQAARRGGRLTQARDLVASELEATRKRVKLLQETIDRRWAAAAVADAHTGIAIRAEIAALQAETQGAIARLLVLERRSADVAFSSAAERHSLGLSFDLFDEAVVASAPRLGTFQLARLMAVMFVLTLLLIAPVIGAFDDRVYAPTDLAASGLPLFGALPAFPGDDVASYDERMGRKRV